MKNRWVRMLAAVASVLMFLLSIGCHPAASISTSTTSDNASQDNSSEESTKSLKESALKFNWSDDLNLGGKELTISTWGSVPSRDDEYFERRYIRAERTEKKYNVKFNWIPVNTTTFVQNVSTAYAAGQKFADLMFCTSFYGFDIAKVGAIVPLDDYIDYSSPYYSMNGDLLKYVDGRHYSYFPDELSPSSNGYAVLYNTTLTEAALDPSEDPLTLYNQGKWDWDAFANVVKKTTVTDSSGKVVQWGTGGWLLDALCLSNGFSPISMANNKFSCELYSDAGLNVLNYIKKLSYDLKGCSSEYLSNAFRRQFYDNKIAMGIGPNWVVSEAITKGMTVAIVPLPVGPDAKGQTIGTEFQEWWTVSSVSDFSTEELLQVALDMNENDPAFEDTYQPSEVVKEKYVSRMYEHNTVPTEEDAEMFYDLLMDKNVEKLVDLTSSDMRSLLYNKIQLPLYQGEDPRTVLERMRSVIDTALQEYLPDSLK